MGAGQYLQVQRDVFLALEAERTTLGRGPAGLGPQAGAARAATVRPTKPRSVESRKRAGHAQSTPPSNKARIDPSAQGSFSDRHDDRTPSTQRTLSRMAFACSRRASTSNFLTPVAYMTAESRVGVSRPLFGAGSTVSAPAGSWVRGNHGGVASSHNPDGYEYGCDDEQL
jgi:hypothetical protein